MINKNKFKKTVILNDTSVELHHGCKTVMYNIRRLLAKKYIQVIDANPAHRNWENNKRLLRNIKNSDFVIINGEGTLHHSQRTALYLLKAAKYCKEVGIPVVLINATYYENKQEFSSYMNNFDLIFVRESLSQNELKKCGIESEVVPDMTFYTMPDLPEKKITARIGFTDSVFLDLSRQLYAYSQKSGNYLFLPILMSYRIENNKDFTSILKKLKFEGLRSLKAGQKILFKKKHDHAYERMSYYVDSTKEYIRAINDLGLLVTGRFHSLCFAIKTQTPFLAFLLDSYKVKGLLTDMGFGGQRIIAIDDLDDEKIVQYGHFSQEELVKIKVYNEIAFSKIETMFDKIRNLPKK